MVGAVLIVGVPLAFGVAALSRSLSDISLTEGGPGDRPGAGDDDAAAPGPSDDVEVVVPDLDDLSGTDEALARVLIDVDRAEREMMDAQAGFAEVLAGDLSGPTDTTLDELSSMAGEGQRTLQEIRRDLTAPVEGGEVRAIRDRYLAHLDAWVRYLVAVEDDPTVLAGGPGTEAFLLSIDTTGESFAREVREGMPEGLDERVRSFALQIVARGFPEREPSTGGGTV